jgi:hypothetical protein
MNQSTSIPQGNHQNIDSTTYIYQSASQEVPLANYFLDFKYLTSSDKLVTINKSDSVKSTNNSSGLGFSVQFTDFVFVVIIFLFSLLAYVRFYGKNYYGRILTSIFNYSYSASFFKEKNLSFVLNSNLLLIVYFLCTALLMGVMEDYFSIVLPSVNRWILFLINLGVILCLVVLYKLMYRFCGILFDQYRIVLEYLFYFSNLLKISGIIYLILLMGAIFSNEYSQVIFVYLAILVTVLLNFIKISRVIMILFRNRFSLYYLILYFCALEIIPVMLLFKIFILISRSNSSWFNILV